MIDVREHRVARTDDVTTRPVTVRVLRSVEEFEHHRSAWESFLRESAEEQAYTHDPALILADLESHGGSVRPLFLVVYEGDEIVCVAPFYVADQLYRIKLGLIQLAAPRVRVLKIYGRDAVYKTACDKGVMLDRVFDTLQTLTSEFDWIMFFELPVGGHIWKYFEGTRRTRHGFRMVERGVDRSVVHFVQLPPTYEEYLSSFSARRRKAWRKVMREFDAQCPEGFEVARLTTPEDAEAFLRDVDTVFPKTWQSRAVSTQHATIQNLDYYKAAAERGMLRSYVLRVKGVPIAFSSGFQHAGMYYFDETGYDSDWRSYSPGTVLLLKMLEDLCAHDPVQECNFGFGAGLQKETFGNYQQPVRIVSVLPKGAMRSALIVRGDAVAQRCYHHLRGMVTRLGIDHWIRERLKRRRRADTSPDAEPMHS